MSNILTFKVSTGLKNIIGRDLITDDFIAVFELVKNAFDAYAQTVKITFEKDKIIIADDGKGMTLTDIQDKWLFVAYSAKKQGTEDDELESEEFQNYRDKIQSKRYYAGAKGIGRFSCDRLGGRLKLITQSAAEASSIEQIEVDWNAFDKNPEDKFIDIPVKHETLTQRPIEFINEMDHGTVLIISKLNSVWKRETKKLLKHSLEKLINPFQDSASNAFKIIMQDESETNADLLEPLERNKINGPVKNFVLETLGLKTTQIKTTIDVTGQFITTELFDRGVLIYKIRRKNDTNPKLKNISFHLFHLNRIAKHNFTRLMGIDNVHFGSIFLYKNGFRIAPYGDVGFDYFSLDSRKAQKHFHRLGTRDLIGRIEILGDNDNLRESSSRDGGLVRNEHYDALVACFINQCLVKLENYLKNVPWSSKEDKDREDLSALENIKAKSALLNLISEETTAEGTELIDVDRQNLNIRTEQILKDASKEDIQLLKEIANKLGETSFVKEANYTEKEHSRILILQARLQEEEDARKTAEEEKRKLEEQLALEKEKNTYLRSSSRSLSEDAKGLVHNIKLTSKRITSNVDSLYDKILNGKIKNEEVLSRLGVIKFNAEKALKISMLITRSNFKTYQNEQEVDLVKYICQYIDVYSDMYEKETLTFEIDTHNAIFIRKINLLDMSVILDDLISNSEKADAKKIHIDISKSDKGTLKIVFSDNGKGVQKRFLENPDEIFELGVTTTDGSGIGLNSVRKALKAMKGEIHFVGNNKVLKGACFEITLA